jgi:formyl-CoA transferase
MVWPAASYLADGTILPKMGSANSTSAPYQVFKTSDGWINIGAANQSNYERLLDVLDAPQLASDPRFTTNALRLQHREALVAILNELLVRRSTDEWMAQFDRIGLPAGPVLDIAAALAHPQTIAREMVVETDHPLAGKVRGLGLPIHFSDAKRSGNRPAPLLGEHTREVLMESGYSATDVDRLIEEKAVVALAQ